MTTPASAHEKQAGEIADRFVDRYLERERWQSLAGTITAALEAAAARADEAGWRRGRGQAPGDAYVCGKCGGALRLLIDEFDDDPVSTRAVYSRPGCVFRYCPHPELCKSNDRCGSPR